MTVTIQLPEGAEQALKRKADAAGLSADSYAQRVLERDLGLPDSAPPATPAPMLAISEEIRRRFAICLATRSIPRVRTAPVSTIITFTAHQSATICDRCVR